MEKPVFFQNRKGESLFGMYFEPDQRTITQLTGITICASSIKYRIGSFRLHTILARYLCNLGYFVMYFDPSGIGDSEGDFETKRLTAYHLEIQNGKLTEDIIDVVTLFASEYKLDNLLLFGICGGAVSALITAASDTRIEGLILLAVPVLYEIDEIKGEVFDEVSVITSEVQSTQIISNIVCKLFQIQTWKKMLFLQISWRHELKIICKAISILALKIIYRAKNQLFGNKKNELSETPVSTHPRFHFLFQKSFFSFILRKKRILFIFAGNDFVTWVFKSEFQDTALYPGNPYEAYYQIHILKDANHIFTGRDTQADLKRIIGTWLQRYFCAANGKI